MPPANRTDVQSLTYGQTCVLILCTIVSTGARHFCEYGFVPVANTGIATVERVPELCGYGCRALALLRYGLDPASVHQRERAPFKLFSSFLCQRSAIHFSIQGIVYVCTA